MFKIAGLFSSVTLCTGRGQDFSIIGLRKCIIIAELHAVFVRTVMTEVVPSGEGSHGSQVHQMGGRSLKMFIRGRGLRLDVSNFL